MKVQKRVGRDSLWVILLDTSGSMGEPFRGVISAGQFDGVAESGAYLSKIDAAIDTLRKQIQGLTGGDLVLIRFADAPSLIFKGPCNAFGNVDRYAETLKVGGGTNVAAAIDSIPTELADAEPYGAISILIISDGLADDPEPAARAAESCVDHLERSRISTVLIDPTPQGNELARAISIGGDVRAVTSSLTLRDAVADNRARLERDAWVAHPPHSAEPRRDVKRRAPAELLLARLEEPAVVSAHADQVASPRRTLSAVLHAVVFPWLLIGLLLSMVTTLGVLVLRGTTGTPSGVPVHSGGSATAAIMPQAPADASIDTSANGPSTGP